MPTTHTYHASVFYNEARDERGRETGMHDGWNAADPMRCVAAIRVDAASPEAALEAVYREMNRVDGTEVVAELPVRSMCVGDVIALHIVIGGSEMRVVSGYAVAPFGFDPIRIRNINIQRTDYVRTFTLA